MSIGYARQKLWEAVYGLVGTGPIQERLAGAALHLILLNKDNFPPDLGPDYPTNMADRHSSIMDRLTNDHRGTFDEAVARLSDDDCAKISREILELYTAARGGI